MAAPPPTLVDGPATSLLHQELQDYRISLLEGEVKGLSTALIWLGGLLVTNLVAVIVAMVIGRRPHGLGVAP